MNRSHDASPPPSVKPRPLAASFRAHGSSLDWRDGDDLSHLHGAEDDDYRAAGMPWTARDGAFETIDELKYLLGMPQQVFDRLAPLLTVYSGSSSLDLEFAPPFLVAALAGDEFIATTPARPDAHQRPRDQGGGFARPTALNG